MMDFAVAVRRKDGTKSTGTFENAESLEQARELIMGEPEVATVLIAVPTPLGVRSSPIPDDETEVAVNEG